MGPQPLPSLISIVMERETTSRDARSLAVGAYLHTQDSQKRKIQQKRHLMSHAKSLAKEAYVATHTRCRSAQSQHETPSHDAKILPGQGSDVPIHSKETVVTRNTVLVRIIHDSKSSLVQTQSKDTTKNTNKHLRNTDLDVKAHMYTKCQRRELQQHTMSRQAKYFEDKA